MRRNRLPLAGAGVLILAAAMWLGTAAAPLVAAEGLKAEIRLTSFGVPHVLANDYAGAGFGLGYAFAKDDICTVADRWVTVQAQRSRYFGPEGARDGRQTVSNLHSDFFWQWVLDTDVVGRELQQPPPVGPTPEVRELVRGYVSGYNRYLAEVGVANIPDPRCRGKEWVRPITEQDVYLRALDWNHSGMFRSKGGLVSAAPPQESGSAGPGATAQLVPDVQETYPPASNFIAFGKLATDNGRGMLFSNPHWRWHEPDRWYEFQLTVPGRLNTYGAGLEGLPFVLFGFNEHVAWTHTASVPHRETVYELRLTPERPTAYIYEGQPRRMKARTVNVVIKQENGALARRDWTFWETHFGPVVESDNYPWTPETAYAVRNITMSFRWLNQQLGMMEAQSVQELDAAGKKYLAIGWLNTAASDSAGRAMYADRTAIPNVTDAMLDACVTSELGKRLRREGRQFVMDGSRAACEWANDGTAPVPGIFGVSKLPEMVRDDYVANSNDSHWLNNPRQPLEGFDRVIGDERTPRSLRTREGLVKIERRLTGADGHPGKTFTLAQLEAITMDNRVRSGELWRDALVGVCRKMPAQQGLPQACDVLAAWDLTENLDSAGTVLWRRFIENVEINRNGQELYATPFDPKDPVNTPRGLKVSNPRVAKALSAAINDLLGSGVPLDAKYRTYHYDERAGVKIPIHGGPPESGQFNFIQTSSGWQPGKGWHTVVHGSSYVMWLQFTDNGPVGRSVLAPSQSDNPESAHHADQTKLFSDKQSKPILFSENAIKADPSLKIVKLCEQPGEACK